MNHCGLAAEALRCYGLESAPLRFIRHHENMTFQVGEQYLLRIHKPAESFAAIAADGWPDELALRRQELDFLRYLRRSGMTVQAPVPALDGKLISFLPDGTPATLLTWLPGRMPGPEDARPEVFHAAGAMLAQLHSIAREYPQTDGRRYDAAYCHQLKALFSHSCLNQQDRLILTQTCDTIAALQEQSEQSFILLHGDITSSNIILTQDGPAPIDFSLLGYGHPMFDLAMLLSSSDGGLDYYASVTQGYIRAGGKVDFSQLEAGFALSILSCIALHLPRWPQQDWFPAALARWQQRYFLPLNEKRPLFPSDFYLLNLTTY